MSSNNEKILEQLKKAGVEGDQLLILAIVSENLSTEEMDRFKGPWKRLCEHLESLQQSHDRRTKILRIVQEGVQQIRLDVKYLQFDLQATKQERDQLKQEVDRLRGKL